MVDDSNEPIEGAEDLPDDVKDGDVAEADAKAEDVTADTGTAEDTGEAPEPA